MIDLNKIDKPASLLCPKCNKQRGYYVNLVEFKNGTQHLEARCDVCNRYIKYLKQDTTLEPMEEVISFGKHKGMKMSELMEAHPDYVEWMSRKLDGKWQEVAIAVIEDYKGRWGV